MYYLPDKESGGKSRYNPRNLVSVILGDERFCDMSSLTTEDFLGAKIQAAEKDKPDVRDIKRLYHQAVCKVTDERMEQITEMLKEKISQRSRSGGSGGVYVLRSAFKFFDKDGSGGLDSEELKNGLEMFGMQIYDYEIIAIMARLDKEFEFEIQYQDFLEGFLSKNEFSEAKAYLPRKYVYDSLVKRNNGFPVCTTDSLTVKRIRKEFEGYFEQADKDGRGRLNIEQVDELLASRYDVVQSDEHKHLSFLRMDKHQNDAVNVEEFWEWFQRFCL